MRLNFSVLWFDDDEEYFDSLDLEPLQDEVLSWGFYPDIKTVTTPEEFRNYSPFKSFDLIVVDRNLEEYPDGQEFIAELRSKAIYTEVIFYTAADTGTLWDAVREKKLEGIFVSDKGTILSKISTVGIHTIRKVLDLENMRGIVIAEVGELDHRLDEIITIGISSLPAEEQKKVFERFCEAATLQNQNNKDLLDAFSKHPETSDMLKLCDSNKRWANFNRLWKKHDKLNGRDRIGEYDKEVLEPRNFLAHGRPELQKDGGVLFTHHGREFHFNDDTSLALRQRILKYKEAFSEIYTILANG